MVEAAASRYRRWGLDELLTKFEGLRVIPTRDNTLRIGGELGFRVTGPEGDTMEDRYSIELRIPLGFPMVTRKEAPTAHETGGRIPRTYHKLEDGSLCLGAPTALRLGLGRTATIGDFVEWFVIPYLYGYSRHEKGMPLPYGELEHGTDGLWQYLTFLFGVDDRGRALEFARLASLKKRVANKERCPCGTGRRLGRCHRVLVNQLRSELGRGWFAEEYTGLKESRSASKIIGPDRRSLSRLKRGRLSKGRLNQRRRGPSGFRSARRGGRMAFARTPTNPLRSGRGGCSRSSSSPCSRAPRGRLD